MIIVISPLTMLLYKLKIAHVASIRTPPFH
jgi:hypothetical protein